MPSADNQSISRLLADMSLAEKIGQMTQVSHDSITPAEVADFAIGSVLSGGNGNPEPNTPEVWVDMVASFVDAAAGSRLGIPLIYGVDAVHGHSNVGGATVFPHNIGLGAAGDEALVRRIGSVTATEMLATGVQWAFAPTVAVSQDIRWGRTYESYGRDSDLVSRLGAALVSGLQGGIDAPGRVLACAKHYVGDGGTTWGTAWSPPWVDWWEPWGSTWQIDQGDLRVDEAELRRTHLPPYRAVIDAGAMSVMASYSSWNGDKLLTRRDLLTDVLKGELGLQGFVVSDWMAVDQLDPDYDKAVATAINAGMDMCMVPFDFRRFIDATTRGVGDGTIPMERIDDAVRRILVAKHAIGLFDGERPLLPLDVIGAASHRRLAAEAARRSAVLLTNNGVLPLREDASVYLAGPAADDIGLKCGGWTVGWQGSPGPTTDGMSFRAACNASLGARLRYDPAGRFAGDETAEIGVVCIAEDPYAEGPGDREHPEARDVDREVFARVRERCERVVLVIFSGRPLAIPDLIDDADAVIAAWLPGSEATQLPGLLTGEHRFEGRLPQPWPRHVSDLGSPDAPPQFPLGHGLGLTADGGPPTAGERSP